MTMSNGDRDPDGRPIPPQTTDGFKRLWDLTEPPPPKKKRKRRKRKLSDKKADYRAHALSGRERYRAKRLAHLEEWAKDIAALHLWTP